MFYCIYNVLPLYFSYKFLSPLTYHSVTQPQQRARPVFSYWCTSLIRNRITFSTLRRKSHRKLFVIRHLTKLRALSLCNISTLKFNKSLPLSLTFHFLGVKPAFHHFIGSLCVCGIRLSHIPSTGSNVSRHFMMFY